MEHSHEQDPKRAGPSDPWDEFTSRLGAVRDHLRDTYSRAAGDEGPSEDEIKSALATLSGMWGQVADSVSTALRDPQTREHLKDAAGSLANALGTTLSQLGDQLHTEDDSEEE